MLTDMPYKIVNAIFFNLIIVGLAVSYPFPRVRPADFYLGNAISTS